MAQRELRLMLKGEWDMGNDIGKENNSGRVSKSRARHSFILLRPDRARNSEMVAKRIAACRGVSEVCLTSGSYAFIIAAKNGSEDDIRRTCGRIRKAAGSGGEVSVALNHYVYRSRR